MIPDGVSDPRVVMDFYSYTDITIPANAAFNIYTLPAQPYNAIIQFPNNILSSVSLTSTNATTGNPGGDFAPGNITSGFNFSSPVQGNTWLPINFTQAAPYWNDTPWRPQSSQLMSASKARVTSMAWRLVYTGPASTCGGLVTVNSKGIRYDGIVDKVKGTVSFAAPITGTVTPYATSSIGQATKALLMAPLSQNAVGKDTISVRPETVPKGIVRKNNTAYTWKEVFETSVLPVLTTLGVNPVDGDVRALVNGGYTAATTGNQSTCTAGTMTFYDEDWDSVALSFSPNSSAVTYRFETWQCMEYIPMSDSIWYNVATTGPKPNKTQIDNVEQAVTKMPLVT
jgi:hypothetical protein